MLHERPIECGECKKSISILYTQIKDGTFSNISMCKQCPQLKQSLHYTLISSQDSNEKNLSLAGELCCGNCGTTLESIRRGGALGCAECYIVFYDILLKESDIFLGIEPSKITHNKTIHKGSRPEEQVKMTPSLCLLSLNEALNETLEKEDYEQAAWLRDQIKEIKEEMNE